jgi:nicotinate-nucleotide pyrophosphorylase (carboxylating)
MDSSKKLNLKNSAYKKAVELYVWETYLNDVGKGDLTIKYFVAKKRKKIIAEVITNEDGIISGIQEAEWFLKKLGIKIIKGLKDGASIKSGQIIMKLKGTAQKILMAERTLLNLLQRMSGVATATNKLSSKLPKSIKLLATRKTLWGLLDKRAVTVGGGGTHRLNLNDAILIKENHLFLSSDLKKDLRRAIKKSKKAKFIEIELENINEVMDFIMIYDQLKKEFTIKKQIVVMLDNFSPDTVKRAISLLKQSKILIEISGSINEYNIDKYAIKGVSAISSGAVTMKASSLDISLNFI